ncbi:CPBP family intramembrane glutamic endopeptidase [Methanobrevibacter sp.]|uniref:CPBP family intramembrane glutamic endopeptidase n=1 Tax=Methanobrevibacter sp. TaxID=66852 RepID=UPI003890610E
MAMNDKISDYITFPKTFENYMWYKPILVFIVGFIIALILVVLIAAVFYLTLGFDFVISVLGGGFEALNSPFAILFVDLMVIVFIPSLYLASKVVKDRPFSSYSSSRGGWNFKLYFKALVIPLILYIIYMGVDAAIAGTKGTSHLSIAFLAVILISVPIQSIAEEYVFRGFLMQTFGSWFKIPALAIVLQAVIFALLHGYNGIGLFETLVMGLGYGFFAWKTNGIEISSAIHTANNFSVGLFVMLGLKTSTSSPQLLDVAVAIAFLIILFIIMYCVGRKTDWFGEIPENSQNI